MRFGRNSILALALAAAVVAMFAPGASARHAGAYKASDEQRVAALINAIRRQHHLTPLVYSLALRNAAREHSTDMLARQYFEHDAPDETFDRRIRRFLAAPLVAEDIGWGSGEYGTPAGMVNLWMHSASHRRIILLPDLRRFGLGVTQGTFQGNDQASLVTADFAS